MQFLGEGHSSVIDLIKVKRDKILRLEFFFLNPEMSREELEVTGLLLSILIALTLDPLLPRGDREGSFELFRNFLGLF